jgi:hypothetical protein
MPQPNLNRSSHTMMANLSITSTSHTFYNMAQPDKQVNVDAYVICDLIKSLTYAIRR